MKRVIFLLALGILFASSALSFAQEVPKIGYVDIQRVLRESEAGKAAKESFSKDFANKKTIIDQKQSQLDKKKEEFFSKAPVMDDEARKILAKEIEDKEKELKRLRSDFREELQEMDFELTRKILGELEGVLEEFGEKRGFTLIIEKTEGGIVYASPATDVTDEVIKVYDSTKK